MTPGFRPPLHERLALPIVRLADRALFEPSRSATADDPILRRPLRSGEVVEFGRSGNADRYIIADDCHVAEEHFRWVNGPIFRFAFDALFSDPATLEIELILLEQRSWESLQFKAMLNGGTLSIERDRDRPHVVRAEVSGLVRPLDQTNLLVIHSAPVRVSDIIPGPDRRVISAGLRFLSFTSHV